MFLPESFDHLMDILEALRARRTVLEFDDTVLSPDTIERLVSFAVLAPNHRLTQPWRFTMLGSEAKAAVADALAADTLATSTVTDEAVKHASADKARSRFLARANVMVVTCTTSDSPAQQRDDLAAVATAIQNLQLAAWAEGIGVQWHTGKVFKLLQTLPLLGIDASQETFVAVLYLGVPTAIPPVRERRPVAEVVRYVP